MRYLILVVLNLPIILLAFTNILTQYKMHKITAARFRHQFMLWFFILATLLASFPVYNLLIDAPILDASMLSGLDIVQTTAIVYLVYIVNDHRRKIERTEQTLRDLHQELAIRLSSK